MTRRDRDRIPTAMTRDPSLRGKPRTADRVAYCALVNAGVGSREAARRVGVDYRTGKYWQAAATAAAQTAPLAPAVLSPRYLSRDERLVIADRVRQPGVSPRAIATELGRSLSTITREVNRNHQPDGVYQPHQAHALAAARRLRPQTGKIAADPVLRAVVQDGLQQRWSPRQICLRLRRDHPDRAEWHAYRRARRAEREDRHPARAVAAVVDLGSGQRDAPARPVHRRHRDAGLLLRPPLPLATWLQREHQRPCCASTSRKAPTCRSTALGIWTRSPPSSTTDPGRRAGGTARPNA
jgi:transposase